MVHRNIRVKNNNPADVQITAEQIIREARQHHEELDQDQRQPKTKIIDNAELEDYRLRKRKEFEDNIRRARYNKNVWVKYANWEESHKDFDRARSVWERVLDVDYKDHTIWLKYVDFEVRNKFVNRARNVLDRAVTLLPRVDQLWRKYIRMEQTLGNDDEVRIISERWMTWKPVCVQVPEKLDDIIESDGGAADDDVLVRERRFQYDQQVSNNPLNYDIWFDYIRFEESTGNKETIRDLYERAIANVPPAKKKRYWQRYIYLWIGYALYEELDTQDVTRAREVLRECLKVIPHKKFTFAKIWLLAADLEIRQLNLSRARAILGKAIGVAPKHKIFKKYIDMELVLGNIDRCRKLYEKYLEWSPVECDVWIKFVEFEKSLNESERVRAIFELAVAQPALDKPELLWKAYIDSGMAKGDLVRRRKIQLNDGRCRYEASTDYLFPEDLQASNYKLLEQAYKWKKQKIALN